MSLPRYPEYKDSGVAWIGQLPMHWDVLRARRLFDECRDAASPDNEQLSATQRYGVIPQRLFMEAEDQKVVLALAGTSNFKRVRKDDFVISLRSFQGGIEHSNYEGCVSPAYTVLRPSRAVASKYWSYMLKSVPYISALQTVSAGIRDGKNISYGQFGSLEVPVPPLEEQRAIAQLLDRETAKIDALIAEQEKLLALLAEKRQATISHAVTRGLDPNAPMKDSGIPWLGEVPAHWEVTRLKFVAAVQTGVAKGKDTSGKHTITVPYLRVANVQDGYLALEDVSTIEIEPEQLDRYRLQSGDVLMNEGGDFDKLGRGALWSGEIDDCIHQNHVFAVRPHGVTPQWLNQVAGSSYAQFYFMGRAKQSTNLASISSTNIMELPILLPPQDEQVEILLFVADESANVDALCAAGRHAIAVLKERRSALITAAVTGQISVRGAVEARVA